MTLGHLPRGDRAEAALPSRFGDFRIAVFRDGDSEVVAMIHGDIAPDAPVLVRLHSECLTGEALGSLRCDCGEQLDGALARIGRAERGVLLYLRHEGRGIGLFDKIRAYALQDDGLDTVDANVALGLPVDGRDYRAAAAALRRLGVHRVRVLTNNPKKIEALERHGLEVVERVPLEASPNPVNLAYLLAKQRRMGHLLRLGAEGALGPMIRSDPSTPLVTVHYAQTIDGRIAARGGDSRWVSGGASLTLAHELRASHDAVLVGIGTVLADDPRLTVRLAPGRSPVRIVVDTTLRIPLDANVLTDGAARTIVVTTPCAAEECARAVRASGAEVLRARGDAAHGVDVRDALARLRRLGLASILVEGGRGMITAFLRARLVDRLAVCIAPKVVGEGIDAVGDLNVTRLREALTFRDARFVPCGDDIVFYGEPERAGETERTVDALPRTA